MQDLVYALAALLGLGAVVTVFVLWDDVRDRLAAWLRKMGLQKSALMDAVVCFDNLVGQIRCRLFVATRTSGTVQIDETSYRLDQISDPEVKAELARRGLATRSVLHLVN